uniref:Uncharacterized protein n=1 Tax=Sipha flava TaxID=143950 RepID=A0A2S2QYS3_9HEMI
MLSNRRVTILLLNLYLEGILLLSFVFHFLFVFLHRHRKTVTISTTILHPGNNIVGNFRDFCVPLHIEIVMDSRYSFILFFSTNSCIYIYIIRNITIHIQ